MDEFQEKERRKRKEAPESRPTARPAMAGLFGLRGAANAPAGGSMPDGKCHDCELVMTAA
ncbi:hypothetical protein [Erythrobacter sp.]|jgi:hypothetical protein|uniref:hypothetical protein n=1 Tax=Erythrobacter sp. TaxID=1042 RepID=UPI002EA60F6E|nr:hypothetical protein [Erythrobacter sp.]